MEFHQILILRFLLILSLMHRTCFAQPQQESEALNALKTMFNDPFLNQNWNGVHCVNNKSVWYGIACFDSRVTAISLGSRGLKAEVKQDAFVNFPELITLNFTNNAIRGNMMDFFSNHKLQILDISGNKFSGPISTSLLELDSLQSLLLQDNGFTGPIPAFRQSSLRQVNFSSNQLRGQIPGTPTLQSFKAECYANNPELCGPPSPNPCKFDPSTVNVTKQDHKSQRLKLTMLTVLANIIGMIVLIIVILLYIKKSKKFGKTIKQKRDNAAGEREEDDSNSHSQYYNESKDIKISLEEQSIVPVDMNQSKSIVPFQSEQGKSIVPFQSEQGKTIVPLQSDQSKRKLIFTGDKGEDESFELTDLLKASAQGLGKGVLGHTYKAKMEGRPAVVVKRLRNLRPLSDEEFTKQLKAIVSHKHPNLLPFLAYFHSEGEKFLVSKYAEKGNLFNLLHGGRGTEDRIPFRWNSRLSVARGVARALEYLHRNTKSETLVPHGDLKLSNILLDKNDIVLVSDYGLIPLITPSIAAQRMSAFKSPEYQSAKRVSKKSDVWTYGGLLMELLTGRMSAQSAPPERNGVDLCSWVRRAVREEWTMEILDLEVSGQRGARDGMLKLLNVGIRCCDKVPEKRPEMAEVVREVEDIKASESEEDSDYWLTDESISSDPVSGHVIGFD